MSASISISTAANSSLSLTKSFANSARIAFNSLTLHGVSLSETITGVGATLIGFRGALFLPLFTGRMGGGMTNRRSSVTRGVDTIGATGASVDFEGNGRAGAFFAAIFL